MIKKEKQIVYLFAYIIDDSETQDFLKITKLELGEIPKDRKSLLNIIDLGHLSESQKLLILFYIYLYHFLHGKEVINNEKLKLIHELLNVSENFCSYLSIRLRSLNPEKILDAKVIIDSVLNPNEYTIFYANNIIFQAIRDGNFKKKQILMGLNPKEYEHPFDKKALNALEGTPGLEVLVRKFNQYGIEKLMKIQYTGSNIKVNQDNFPHLFKALVTVCDVISYRPIPDLYVNLGFINAWTIGVDNPLIVLTSGCVGLLSYDELLFVLGHEVGHIKSRHILYHQMALILPILGNLIGSATLGIGGLISSGFQIALLNWQRKSEFTADRAGLLACQNVNAATTAMMKIAGAPPRYYSSLKPSDFEKQAKEFEEFDLNNYDKVAKAASVMFADHPWTVMRGHALYKWIESGDYDKILKRPVQISNSQSVKSLNNDAHKKTSVKIYCTNCGYKYKTGEKFCIDCGEKR